jgi:hypothetical protein
MVFLALGPTALRRPALLAAFVATTTALGAAPRAAGAQPAAQSDGGAPSLVALVGPPSSELAAVVDRFSADRATLLRRYDASGSPDQRQRLRGFYAGWRSKLREVDFDKLGQEGRIDYVLLDARLRHELDLLDRDEKVAVDARRVLPFADALLTMYDARRNLVTIDPATAARTLRSLLVANWLEPLFEDFQADRSKRLALVYCYLSAQFPKHFSPRGRTGG